MVWGNKPRNSSSRKTQYQNDSQQVSLLDNARSHTGYLLACHSFTRWIPVVIYSFYFFLVLAIASPLPQSCMLQSIVCRGAVDLLTCCSDWSGPTYALLSSSEQKPQQPAALENEKWEERLNSSQNSAQRSTCLLVTGRHAARRCLTDDLRGFPCEFPQM